HGCRRPRRAPGSAAAERRHAAGARQEGRPAPAGAGPLEGAEDPGQEPPGHPRAPGSGALGAGSAMPARVWHALAGLIVLLLAAVVGLDQWQARRGEASLFGASWPRGPGAPPPRTDP